MEKCLMEGLKLGYSLELLGGGAFYAYSADDYELLAKRAMLAGNDLRELKCISEDERKVLAKEIDYLKRSAEQANFLYTQDAAGRLLQILHNPEFYLEYFRASSIPEGVTRGGDETTEP